MPLNRLNAPKLVLQVLNLSFIVTGSLTLATGVASGGRTPLVYVLGGLAIATATSNLGLLIFLAKRNRQPRHLTQMMVAAMGVVSFILFLTVFLPLTESSRNPEMRLLRPGKRLQSAVRNIASGYEHRSPSIRDMIITTYETADPVLAVPVAKELLLVEDNAELQTRLLRILDSHLGSDFTAKYSGELPTRDHAQRAVQEIENWRKN